ncbi:MAG TPA: tetratricopeptide repeat protein [Candidatus Paceibacterota bacterium]|nr:tetratricopeptide repeat protein [Candidatus Paceibacterota bacterium]
MLCLLLALLTVAIFLPVAWQGFVNYDDSDYVTENTHVQGGLKWTNIVWAFTTGHASNWHPLTWLSHMLDSQLFGLNAGGHHLVSVAFHIANALLLFLLLRCMTGALWRSLVVAGLFSLHPLHVESVAWASERKDVLSAFFFLLTIWAYARYAEGGMPVAEGRRPGLEVSGGQPASSIASWSCGCRLGPGIWYLLALGCFGLGLMSKPMLVTLPFVLVLLDYWPLRRFRCAAVGRLVLEKVPFLLLAAASSVITFIVQRKGGAVSTSLTLGERLANALVSYVRYIGKMLWPKDLSILYPHPGHWPAWQVVGSAVLLVAVCVVVFLLARRRPYLAVGWLWFCGTLVPVIGLVQVGIQSMADRYTYLPLIGLFIMVAWGLEELVPERPWRGGVLAIVAALSLAVCALLTERQIRFWRDSEALFRHAVQVTANNYLAYNNLGFYLNGRGRTSEAMENYRMALKINPAYEDALNNLGYALAGQKKFAEAVPLYEAALRVRPNHAEVHNNLGNALSELGRIDEAIQHYRIVLEQKPEHADAHNNLGIALAMKGKLDEAVPHFYAAIRYKPNYASAHSNLGNALAVQHKLDEAIKEYQTALRLKPEDPQAHNNLGNALAEQGKAEEAIDHYREAIRLNAVNPEAHFNLALALLRLGKREEAINHLTEALRLKPDYAEAQNQLKSLTGRSGP